MEAVITSGLTHPNVLRTLRHTWRPVYCDSANTSPIWGSTSGACIEQAVPDYAGRRSGPDGETWLLLEYCDLGTLQVGQ